MDQPKIIRELQLLMLLAGNRYMTNREICERFEFTERTFFRYLDSFRSAGFAVKRNENNVYRLEISAHKLTKSLGDLLYFSEEEALILRNAIDSIGSQTQAKEILKKKLYAVYDYKVIADIAVESHDAKVIQDLKAAIENCRQVVLKDYRSAHSNTTSDRLVEPYALTSGADQIWCYELETQTVKIFKISRIGQVVATDIPWAFTDKHATGYVDIFRMHSTQRFPIKLRLSLRAANLLMEEYPLSTQYLSPTNGNRFLLQTDVCSLEGATRFILGLFNDVEILENDELKAFVQYKVKMMVR